MPRPSPGAMGKVRFDKASGKSLLRVFSYIRGKNLILFILSIACTFVSALISVKSSLFMQTLIDELITPLIGNTNPDFSAVTQTILHMAMLYGCAIVALFFHQIFLARVTRGVLKTIRDEMFVHMQGLPIRYFDSNKYGDIMSVYINDIDTMRQMLSQSIPQVLQSAVTIVSVFIAMVKLSLPLTGIVIANVILMNVIVITVGGKSAKYFVERQKTLGSMNGFMEEMINGQKVVKVFCHEEKAKAEFDKRNADLNVKTTKANAFANILMPILVGMGNLQYVVIAIVGAALAIGGKAGLTLGAIASFLLLSKSFNQPISQISQQINSVVMALAGAQRVFKIMDQAPETDEGFITLQKDSKERWHWHNPKAAEGEQDTPLKGDVRFFDVDFSYEPEKPILHDINLYAKPGQKIAFVGSTGAGKTTITNLINRFYDIQDGKILYDGLDIKDIKKPDLRKSLGIVLQDVNLFTGTIKENIRYGNPNATDEEIVAAAKLANADGFIRKLPNGYDTEISGTGSKLSQGQCQLISIARCAAADPPVMILDEATSSIDTRTESLVQAGMDSLMGGRTTFVIAHRLSTVQNSNAIMVLEKGRIIERGDHDDLLAQQGRYYQLYTGNAPAK